MIVLGIETSCDETAVALVTRKPDGSPKLLANNVLSQFDIHAEFGGVVPEIAARSHLTTLDHLIEKTLHEAGLEISDITLIAATAGPGLVGGLMVGVMTAKAIAAATAKPWLAINHLEGHALTARLTDDIGFPYLLFLVSGGHTQIIKVAALGKYERYASTIDDAIGEAFDKTAKLLSLPMPGGPSVEQAAAIGDPRRFDFPRPLQGKATLNMSFSGLKTAVRQQARALSPLSRDDINDICASFQFRIAQIMADRAKKAMARFENETADQQHRKLVIAGGVAANREIRQTLETVCYEAGWELIAPPIHLCSDNAAMIAWAGLEKFEQGEVSVLDLAPRSRWPLDERTDSIIGSGRRGAKA